MDWRWDQGRLEYFQFDEIRNISKALIEFDGCALPRGTDPDSLREILKNFSAKPFAPDTTAYKVWRNYGRVFGCQLLAAKVGELMVCTELCQKLASNELDVDDYFLHFANHFYYPSPIFEGYSTTAPQIFPVISIIKLLLAKLAAKQPCFTTLEEVAGKLIGNNCNGKEPVAHYVSLSDSGFRLTGDAVRQIRELLIFISQFSFLKWDSKKLFLDIASAEEALIIENALIPSVSQRDPDATKELLKLGGDLKEVGFGEITSKTTLNPMDQEFTEGSKVRVTHLRSERSGKLREVYFSHISNAHVCNMCTLDTAAKYPWADRIIELHHLLPLSSPIRFESESSTLKDLVGLCPTCHRATHKFYTKWLKTNSLKDFRTYDEARNVYQQAKSTIVLAS